MKTILLFGAGKSATSLIDYLGICCRQNNWNLVVCDNNFDLAARKIRAIENATAVSVDVLEDDARKDLIQQADIVISMMPPALHFLIACDCVTLNKNLLTASYIDENIQSLKPKIEEKGLLFIGEMGLDPGIDHMSAMQLIESIKSKGGKITSFVSHCGGLIAPESDDNPWRYKITWNPANVVSAGRAGANYLLRSKKIHIPYEQIFSCEGQILRMPIPGPLAWYPNRDSLSYLNLYDLHDAYTFIRTTLRYPSFCAGWNNIVQMNLTAANDTEQISGLKTIGDWFRFKSKGFEFLFTPEFEEQAAYLGLYSNEAVPAQCTTSASILQYLLETRLRMKPSDRDMIVMVHEIEYLLGSRKSKARSVLIVKGDDPEHTAMSKTVGLPLGIAAHLILTNRINLTGLHIPILPQIYVPVLRELALHGIEFQESKE